MRGSCLLAACYVALGVMPVSAQNGARSLTAYIDAVRVYQQRDLVSAAITLMRWPQRNLDEVSAALLQSGNWELVEAAAMLHTEIASREIVANPKTAINHLAIAETLVRELPSSQASLFQPRWYAFAASIFLAETDPKGARVLIDRGLQLATRDSHLHVMSGAIQELLAHIERPECSGPGCDTRSPGDRAFAMLGQAETEYRLALDLDHDAAEARLRLGRVLFLTNRLKQAREELDTVLRASTNVRLQYLARLFLGGIDDYENDFAHARLEYGAALQLAPGFQTPYIALSFAEHMTGESARARLTAAAFLELPASVGIDPWWEYQSGGQDDDALLWLRARVQR